MSSVRIAWDERGDGDPIVLVHGLGYARWGWEPVVAPLAESYRVIRMDNRGIGESDVPEGPYTVRAMAEDVVRVLDEARAERAHVVGTSLGGMVAQELAIAWPDRVVKLVLACTTPGGAGAYPIPQRTLDLIAQAPSLAPEVALRRFVENALSPTTVTTRPDLVEQIYERRLASPPDPRGWQAQAAAATSFDAFDRLGRIQAPTLVLHGTADRVVEVRNAAILGDRIPDARVELFADAGHLFFWEEPERFVRSVRGFLG